VEEALQKQLLEVELLRQNRSIVTKSKGTNKLTQGSQVHLDHATLHRVHLFVESLVKLVFLDKHASLEDADSLANRSGCGILNSELSYQVNIDFLKCLVLSRNALGEDVVDEPVEIDFKLFVCFYVSRLG
jgi:hypothetical protein